MNTDGTTLQQQKKLGSIAINNVVVSVNEQSDGTADSIVNDVSRELEKLRETAQALGIPNSNSINWTLISSSTSDSAATQKRFNKLIEQQKEADREKFGDPLSNAGLDRIFLQCILAATFVKHSSLESKMHKIKALIVVMEKESIIR